MTTSNKKWQWMTANDSEWWNEWKQMRVSKVEWFYVSKWNKRPIWIILFNFLCNIHFMQYNYFSKQPLADVFRNRCYYQHWCFPVNIAKSLGTVFLKKHLRWLFLYYIFIGNLMTYINREIDDIYFQYSILCLFFAISFVELIETR